MYFNILDRLKLTPEEIIVYLRKSRSDDPNLTVEEVLARHEAELNEWALTNLGAPIPEENKYREVVSGETIADRPEVQKVLSRIESPKIKAILIVEVERLSRGDLEDAGRLIKLLRYTNTYVITKTRTYDISDEDDRDRFERMLKSGNEYLEYQKKIMKRGKDQSVKEGWYIGSRPPFGYEKIYVMDGKRKRPTLNLHEEQAPVVFQIFDLYYNKDYGIYTICRDFDKLGVKPPKGKYWSPASVRDILQNPHYIGKVYNNNREEVTVVENGDIIKTRPRKRAGEYELFDGKHPAIIPEEWFWGTQDKLGSNAKTKGESKLRNPLAGLVYCQCGRAMTYRTYKDKEGNERNEPRLMCIDRVHCHTGSCTYSEMENIVIDILIKNIAESKIQLKNENGSTIKTHEKLIKNLEKKYADLEARELAQWEAQANPDPAQRMPAAIFQKLNEKLQKEKEETAKALEHARATMPSPAIFEERIARFSEALEALKDPTKEAQEKNRLLKACITRITYSRPDSVRMAQSTTEQVVKRGGWVEFPIEIDVKLKL